MHIATITSSISRNAGGLFPLIRGLNHALLSRNVRITVLGLEDEFTAADAPEWKPLDLRTFPVHGPRAFGYAPDLHPALNALAPDLSHAHGLWMYPSVVNNAWAQRTRRPYLISPQGMLDPWALRNAGWKKRIAGAAYEDRHLRSAACLHAVSAAEADALRTYGLKNPICIIPNGIDLPPQNTPTPAAPWPATFQNGRAVLLFLGRLHPKKGLVPLLDAWHQIIRDDPRHADAWCLAIAGWDQLNHRAALEQQATRLNLTRHIHFCGPLHGDAKDAAFRNASAFVLPSHSEGMPAAVLEAWSYNLPVMMTPACNLPEGFSEHAALSITPDSTDIARGLSEAFRLSTADRAAMGTRGRTLVADRFTWDSLAARMHRVYTWAVNGGTPPADVRLN